jgi:molybdopterin-containing oxidoreductase family membrane subunit
MGHNIHVPKLPNADDFSRDLLASHASKGKLYRNALLITGGIFSLGILAFLVRFFTEEFNSDNREPWAYYAAMVAFLLTTAGAAPIVAVALRLVKAHWRRPMTRVAEIYGSVGLLTLLLFIPLLFLIPSASGRRTIWFQDHDGPFGIGTYGKIPGAPHAYDLLALLFLVICGLALLYLSALPDIAKLRDQKSESRVNYNRLSLGWYGTWKQWKIVNLGVTLLGVFYLMLFIYTMSIFSIDLSLSLVPGWRDAIYPTFQTLTALQAGLAATIVGLYLIRRFARLEQYIGVEQFWGASKILLALSLLWFYFWWSGFIVYWYGRIPAEKDILELFMFGPYMALFIAAFLLCFVCPFLILLWNSVRKTVWGPTLAGVSVLLGTLVDKIRLYVPSWSITDSLDKHALSSMPGTNYPDIGDLLMVFGGIAGAIFIYLLVSKIVPIVSFWEMKEGMMLRTVRRYLRREIIVHGKPD